MGGFRPERILMATPSPDQESTLRPPNGKPLGQILLDRSRQERDGNSLILKQGLTLSEPVEAALRALLEQLQAKIEGPLVLSLISNAAPQFNPWSGIESGPETPSAEALESLIRLLGPGLVHEWSSWPDHCALLSSSAQEILADPAVNRDNAMDRLRSAGGRVLVADSLYAHDSGAPLFDRRSLEPHEERKPTPWGVLTQRLENWLRETPSASDAACLEDLRRASQERVPKTLHVTHNWGGGVARWVESFIQADRDGINFQLRAEGPQSSEGCGQRLSLYLETQLDAPVASWWLQPAIQSSVDRQRAYRAILRDVTTRYGIGRVIVSSLVGHSLDALATGLPTVQVLHDFYPCWPLLDVHPARYLQEGRAVDLAAAFQDHPLLPAFRDRDADSWRALGERWREMCTHWGVRLVAPSRSVVDLLHRLDPAWTAENIEVIPHGLPPLPGSGEVRPRQREDGRLRLVVPGRMLEGKGQRLLLDALPGLSQYARVCLLGAGQHGKAFFGRKDVDVIVEYQRDNLRQVLGTVGPHVAALLSIVPETFSYTLSEMQQLRIPVIATRVGSLAERIADGETGWLIEPDPAALVARLRHLAGAPEEIEKVRERLRTFDLGDARAMVTRYGAIAQPRPAAQAIGSVADTASDQVAALAFQVVEHSRELRRLQRETGELQDEVEKRTAWAEERERARQAEEDRRIKWVSALETQLDDTNRALQQELEEHAATTTELQRVGLLHQQLKGEHERLRNEHDWVLATRSWRLTRPFRAAGRMAANLRQAGAWNPLRWPLLLAQATRTVRTRGLRGALLRAQRTQAQGTPPAIYAALVKPVGEIEAPSAFPLLDSPDVSIVIPVHGKWAYTAGCLRSLADVSCEASFEVIVVDDRSDDETAEELARIEGLVCIHNEQNLGFVGSCNRGAGQARGRYLVFLNNDTQVLDGWLDALIETFEQHPECGLAGARLLYPDGRLQEAGGIIFRDGSGWNYGRYDAPDRPEYLFAREVDYCSGACIMLPSDVCRELGGFDMQYAPAYYEDTDLAFRVRALGLQVRIQPLANIVHHEGVTSGTDTGSGTKRFQSINREKFLQRWQAELEDHPPPVVDPDNRSEIRRARDHGLKGRVLVVDAYTPEPDQDSGSLRLRYLMDCLLDLGYGVTFLPDNRGYAGRYTQELQAAGIEALYDPWVRSLQGFFSERGPEFDFVMISRHYVASRYLALLRKHCPDARFIFDTVDLHYLREERLAELEQSLSLKRSAAQTRRSELGVIEAADVTLVVSPVEQAVLREAAPDARVCVISNVHEVVGSRRPHAERKDIFFVGGYQHPPNIDAVQWFVGSVWPLIREQLPDVVFHLIGSKAPEQVRALHGGGVKFHGYVEDLDPFLDGCRIAVAPLRYGAGIKGKVNLSMSRGQPVVATPTAVEGMFVKPGQDVLVAETAEEFAASVVRLYGDEDLWNRISTMGLENVERYFSVETARLGLQELLDSLR
jgi:GT2 family glycosyltransferase